MKESPKTPQELADWINRRPYVAMGGIHRIDGDWIEIAVNIPTGYRRGIPLFCQILKLFIRSAWKELA